MRRRRGIIGIAAGRLIVLSYDGTLTALGAPS